jgi:hypothetical protein
VLDGAVEILHVYVERIRNRLGIVPAALTRCLATDRFLPPTMLPLVGPL